MYCLVRLEKDGPDGPPYALSKRHDRLYCWRRVNLKVLEYVVLEPEMRVSVIPKPNDEYLSKPAIE